MALIRKRYGAHLDAAARRALEKCRAYPPASAVTNPMTRPLVRRLAEAEWRATLAQLDFSFEIEDCRIADVPCAIYRTERTRRDSPVILYLHAGAFFAGSARVNAAAALPTCQLSGFEAVAVNYSLVPDALFPTQLDEIERVYLDLCSNRARPENIVFMGDSAGACFAAAMAVRLKRRGLPAPAGVMLISPPLDATASSDAYLLLQSRDPIFPNNAEDGCRALFQLYAGGVDITHPEVSPLNSDLAGFPPSLIHVGTREIFLGDAARFAEKARAAGCDVTLRVYDGMFHLFHQHWRLQEARSAHADLAAFAARVVSAGA